MKSVIQPLAKSVLIPLELTAAASAADAEIHKKILGSGHNTILIVSNDEMKDILKIVKSLENSGLLLEGVSETIKNEAKEQKGGFLSMLLGTVKSIRKYVSWQRSYKSRQRNARLGYGSKKSSLKNFF